MAYGELKVDSITFTNGGTDTTVSVSGLVQNPTFSGDITVTGTISGSVVQGGTTVSGATVTGTAGEFGTVTGNTAGFTTVTGTTVTGTTANFVSGVFTSLSGTTATVTSGVFASGTAAAPSVSVGTTDNGLYSPGTDEVAISTNGTGRLFVESTGSTRIEGTGGPSLIIKDTDSASGASTSYLRFWGSDAETGYIGFVGGSNYYINNSRSSGAILFRTEDTERLRITADGKLGLGTSSPSSTLDVEGIVTAKSGAFDLGGFLNKYGSDANSRSWWIKTDTHGFGDLAIRQSTTQSGSSYDTKLLINSTGNVGIGTTSPGVALHVDGDIRADGIYGETDTNTSIQFPGSDVITFNEGGSEAARIDSSGRLLVGTSTSRGIGTSPAFPALFQIETTSYVAFSIANNSNDLQPAYLMLGKSRGGIGSNTLVQNGDGLGYIGFAGADGTDLETRAASISCEVDGTPGANDMPGRLVFSTTADGAASPTERMRITNDGSLYLYTLSGSVSAMANLKYDTSTKEVYYDTSSRLAKENIEEISYGLDVIDSIIPRKYTAIDGDPDKQILGFIADELETVIPEAVYHGQKSLITGNEDDVEQIPLGVTYEAVIPVLVKALQEAKERIESLEAEVAALKAQ